MKRQKEYYGYPKRTCRTLHMCNICDGRIVCGQEYFDGGYGRRCHVECAPPKKGQMLKPYCETPVRYSRLSYGEGMKYKIGDLIKDKDGNKGIVVIKWNDGDLCGIENDAAHPNPEVIGHWPEDNIESFLAEYKTNA